MALGGAAACGSEDSSSAPETTATVTQQATAEATTTAEGSHGGADVRGGTKPLENSAFASWLHRGSISTTEGEELGIVGVESHYDPEQRMSWAVVELDGGHWAPIFFQHGELLDFAPLYGEKPSASQVNETTVEISGDAGDARVSYDRGTLTVDGMGTDVPQLNLRHHG